MTPRKRSPIPILLVLAALGVAVYFTGSDDGERERRAAAAKIIRSAPDISLEGIRQTFVENGEKKWALTAAAAFLSRSSRQTRINDIDVTFFTAAGRPARVTADSGLLSLDTNDAEISGNVIVHNQDFKIYTRSLRYQAGHNIITTEDRVVIESDSLHLTGNRLRYDLVSGKTELAGNVNGTISGDLARQ